jgi:A/G-specific adenine glycosylase
MLQQTQVKTVVPYWQRWIRRLPDVRALARARPDVVLKLWEGLGYYLRARNLQKAARIIIDRHEGRFPEKFDDLLALPGIGRYTAGAVCSIAFNQPKPVLDGNVIRVLTRLSGIAENPRRNETNARLWEFAQDLVLGAARREQPGERNCSDFNQSLMELGAVLCTPRLPKCPLCPVRKHCVAGRENRTDVIPNLGPARASTRRRFVAFVVERNGRFLVRRRPAGVVNAHLWEFPNVELHSGQTANRQLAENLFDSRPFGIAPLFQVRHSITRFRITLDVFRVQFAEAPRTPDNGRWRSLSELRRLAFPSAHKRILQMLRTLPITDDLKARTPSHHLWKSSPPRRWTRP